MSPLGQLTSHVSFLDTVSRGTRVSDRCLGRNGSAICLLHLPSRILDAFTAGLPVIPRLMIQHCLSLVIWHDSQGFSGLSYLLERCELYPRPVYFEHFCNVTFAGDVWFNSQTRLSTDISVLRPQEITMQQQSTEEKGVHAGNTSPS